MTKIPSVEERAGELWRCIKHDFEKEGIELPNSWNGIGMAYGGYARAIEALTADRTALLTELREWARSKKGMKSGNEQSQMYWHGRAIVLFDLEARLDELINPVV